MTDYRVDARSLPDGDEISEAWRFPAAVDLFTCRGAEDAEALARKVRAAGYGAAALYPEKPICTSRELRAERALAPDSRVLRPLPSAAKDDGAMAEIGLMSRGGEKLFCLSGGFSNLRQTRNLLWYASNFQCRIALSPCLKELCGTGYINEGFYADRLGMKGLPSVGESLAVEIALQLAAEWHTPIHLRGLTCRRSLEAVARAKEAGQDVTCDVAAANLMLDDSIYTVENLKGQYKLWPVVRSAEDRALLWKALDSGVIDAIVSGYCPRSADDLALPFEKIPFGSERMTGLIGALMDAWEEQKRPCRMEKIIEALYRGPRRILGAGEKDIPEGQTLFLRRESGWSAVYEARC
ncbi:MAG: hypothetical protein ACOYD9_01040 [Pyramidobacter sp.]|jgi:dihydroorotase-like cyclic amidohydrolase